MTKILLVEDDKSLREIYGVRLLAEGYDIVSAGDGEEALAMAIKERPNLILSDVMMPKISGFDMLDILRSTTETRDIKVIIMTALSSEDQRVRGESLGADMYLVKSQVGIEDVVRSVKEILARPPVIHGQNPSPAPLTNQVPVSQPMPQLAPTQLVQPQPLQQPAVPAPQTQGQPMPQRESNNIMPSERQEGGIRERTIQPPIRPKDDYNIARAMENELNSNMKNDRDIQSGDTRYSSENQSTGGIKSDETIRTTLPTPKLPRF